MREARRDRSALIPGAEDRLVPRIREETNASLPRAFNTQVSSTARKTYICINLETRVSFSRGIAIGKVIVHPDISMQFPYHTSLSFLSHIPLASS